MAVRGSRPPTPEALVAGIYLVGGSVKLHKETQTRLDQLPTTHISTRAREAAKEKISQAIKG